MPLSEHEQRQLEQIEQALRPMTRGLLTPYTRLTRGCTTSAESFRRRSGS